VYIELAAFALECLLQPNNICTGGGDELETPDLKGHQFEAGEMPGQAIEVGEIHRSEIVPEVLVTANALVIV
jgi:hypothetical protein